MKRTEAMPKPNSSIAAAGGGDDVLMIGEAEIIVGAEVDRLARALGRSDADSPALRPRQQSLALGEARRLDLVQGRADVSQKGV